MNPEKIANKIFKLLPNVLNPVKRKIILSMLKVHGKNIRGMWFAFIDGYDSISIGDNFFAAEGLKLSSTQGIVIGNDVTFGPEVMLIGGNHKTNTAGLRINQIHTGDKLEKIIIEDDVWIGARSIVLSGVTITEGTIIGAGSVVTKSMPSYCVCAGNPCKPLKPRFISLNDLKQHLDIVVSQLTIESILEQYSQFGLDFYA